MKYQPHIDGLRAFAVLAVVLYHFGVGRVTGGFVGVDVFFVISGYLITSVIASDLAKSEFSFSGFYARRARRILPASLVLTTAVAILGWAALRPTDLQVLGKSTVATVCFASNFFFLQQADYFGADSRGLHLLHTWSLAIEEQFYFLFPLFLFSLRRSPARTFWVTVALALVSFVACVVETPRDAALAFYVLPTRAWELLVGALLALRSPPLAGRTRLASALVLFGFGGLAASSFGFRSDTPFPGFSALAPTLAAALLVVAGGHAARWAAWPLTNRVATGIGKISYSLYLWHWPLLVAYERTLGGPPRFTAALLVPLFVVSYLSYRFVEQPFRRRDFLSLRPRLAMALTASAALGAFGVVSVATHGMVFGLDARAAAIADAPRHRTAATMGGVCFSTTTWDRFAADECLRTKPRHRSVLLWGDSVAAHYSAGLRAAARGTDVDILQVTMHGCPPSLGWDPKNRPLCKGRNDAVLEYLKRSPPSLVVLGGQWPWDARPALYKAPLSRSLATLHDLGLHAVVLGPPIQYKRPLPELLVESIKRKAPFRSEPALNPLTKKIDADMKQGAVPLSGARFVSLFDLMCGGWDCPTLTPEGAPLEWDIQHLTQEGSLMVGKKLFPVIREELDRVTKPH